MVLEGTEMTCLYESVAPFSRDVGVKSLEEVLSATAANAAVVRRWNLTCKLQGVVVEVHEEEAKVWPGIGCIWIFSPCFGKGY